MDIDRFIVQNRPVWRRLSELTERAGASRRSARLDGPELDELVRLYLRVSSHLSTVRTVYRDPALTLELSALVGNAGAVVYGTRQRALRAIGRFFSHTFPAAVWHARRPIAISFWIFLLPAVIVATWVTWSPTAFEATMPDAMREAYLERDFAEYYSSQPAAEFASEVFTNNVRVAAFAFAGGIALCVLTVWVMALNGAYVGVAAGMFHHAGSPEVFWGLIVPHGLLELTAVFIAGGAGLRLGWSIIDPGDRLRRDALVEEARRAVVIVLGLVLAFLVAGLIEAFVTPSGLPTAARVGLGVLAELAFVTYLVVQGRRAAAAGLTGALGEERRNPLPLDLQSRSRELRGARSP